LALQPKLGLLPEWTARISSSDRDYSGAHRPAVTHSARLLLWGFLEHQGIRRGK